MSLLLVCFKALECLDLQRILPDMERILTPDQASLHRGRSTCDQVLVLTTFVENDFQRNLKTGAVFIDLTAVYNTVWHTGLLVKVSWVLLPWVTSVVELFLCDRQFRVHIGEKMSAWRQQSNGLPQGSVLSPTQFNLYINDLPAIESQKFFYADDICCGTQARTFHELDATLN